MRPGVVRDGRPLFDEPYYEYITRARLEHLESLQLPFAGRRVVDVGAGVGRLSEWLAQQDAEVLCLDGREENIAALRHNYPDRATGVVDVETDALLEHGKFDVVFCYGLLYHLADPFGFIKRMAAICADFAVIETCVTDARAPLLNLISEYDDETMGLRAAATRPSPSYVATCLQLSGFPHVYSPTTVPDHPDFQFRSDDTGDWYRDGNALRAIFVASRAPLDRPLLRPLSPELPPPR